MYLVLLEIKEVIYNIDTTREKAKDGKRCQRLEQQKRRKNILRKDEGGKKDEIFCPLPGPHAANHEECSCIAHVRTLFQWATIHTPAMIKEKPAICIAVMVSFRKSHEAMMTIT